MKRRFLSLLTCIWLIALFLSFVFFRSVSSQSSKDVVVPTISATSSPTMPLYVDPNIPRQIYPCLAPKADQISLETKGAEIKKIELFGQTMEKNQTFYYMNIDTITDTKFELVADSYRHLVKLDPQGNCLSLYPEDIYAPLSYYVSTSVARELAKQYLYKEIERAGSKEKYQQELNDAVNHMGTSLYFSPEEIWAHQQLGISIPDGYRVLTKPTSRSGLTDILPDSE